MIYLQLFLSFAKIGITSFGGLSMIPLVASEMLDHGWMTAQEVADIVAIAEMTPGPLGLNCATFAGTRTAGVLGAVAANLGAMAPTLTLCVLVAAFFHRFRKSTVMQRVMLGIRPACIGMITGVIVSLALNNYAGPTLGVSLPSVGIGLVALFLLMKVKLSVPKVIIISGGLGILTKLIPMLMG